MKRKVEELINHKNLRVLMVSRNGLPAIIWSQKCDYRFQIYDVTIVLVCNVCLLESLEMVA